MIKTFKITSFLPFFVLSTACHVSSQKRAKTSLRHNEPHTSLMVAATNLKFYELCQSEDASEEQKTTIVAITKYLQTNNCLQAAKLLMAKSSLNLANSHLSNLEPLSDLPYLRALDISRNNITELNSIQDLHHLTNLSAHHNHISDLSPLLELGELVNLDLANNDIRNLDSLGQCYKLRKVNLMHNHLQDLRAFEGMENLSSLKLSFNQIDDLSAIAHLKSLQAKDFWFWSNPLGTSIAKSDANCPKNAISPGVQIFCRYKSKN